MKRWVQFTLCLVLSFGIWLIHNLSQTYADVVNVPVYASSNLTGRAENASSVVVIVARCRTNGFRLRGLAHRRKPARVFFNPEDLTHIGEDVYGISSSDLNKYVPDIFGDGVSMDALIQNVEFRFPEENSKKVPVIPVRTLSFKPQYMALQPLKITPDSVTVYGEPTRLRNIDAVVTRQFSLKDVSRSVHGSVRLEQPSGLRMSDKEVAYFLDVTRYVELRSTVHVGTRNVPAGVQLSVYPPTVEAVWRCVFPAGTDPTRTAEFFIDYREFENSLSGRCAIRSEGIGGGIISCELTPAVCDCLLGGVVPEGEEEEAL